jgi:hypothetical protein
VLFIGTQYSNLYTAVALFYRPTGRPRRTSLTQECATQLGQVPFSLRCLLAPLSGLEEQSRTRGGKSSVLPAAGGDGAWSARTGSGPMLMRGDIFAASRGGGAGY